MEFSHLSKGMITHAFRMLGDCCVMSILFMKHRFFHGCVLCYLQVKDISVKTLLTCRQTTFISKFGFHFARHVSTDDKQPASIIKLKESLTYLLVMFTHDVQWMSSSVTFFQCIVDGTLH